MIWAVGPSRTWFIAAFYGDDGGGARRRRCLGLGIGLGVYRYWRA